MSNYHHNSNQTCHCAELLVTVLYDEANAQEKREFANHLNVCASCCEEFAALRSVKNFVAEWRDADFYPLQTPLIELPELNQSRFKSSAKTAWREQLLAVFSGQINRWQTAAAFAGLLVVAYLTIFGYSVVTRRESAAPSDQNNMTAQLENRDSANSPPVNSVAVDQPIELPKTNKKAPAKAVSSAAPAAPKVTNQKFIATTSVATHSAPAVQAIQNPPVLNLPRSSDAVIETVDDLDDNSLRLSDLLDDVTPSM